MLPQVHQHAALFKHSLRRNYSEPGAEVVACQRGALHAFGDREKTRI